ncbi:hypothetical protein HPB50_023429 [Hyalomma asiaticum]|uniref:Uncharacterized protein n=1 Tax=Hyalomma asiaticum TaxID=266040 RepID=A0ACB7TQD0_HYAAI|nr:hypothetical protein HPB50_023429 [Hyalomma asiaticum]
MIGSRLCRPAEVRERLADIGRQPRRSEVGNGRPPDLASRPDADLPARHDGSTSEQQLRPTRRTIDRIGSLGEERRDGEIEGITARWLRLAAPPVTAASAALRLGARRKPEHPIAIYDGDEARLV